MRPDPDCRSGRAGALATGAAASVAAILATVALTAAIGSALLSAVGSVGMDPKAMSYWVFAVALVPFVAMGMAVPWLRDLPPSAPARRSATLGPYVDVVWRYGFAVIPILSFVSVYRMGDVMALTLSHPLFNALGYGLEQISVADGLVALLSSMLGVALGGWLAARAPMGRALVVGAIMSAFSNWVFAWLAWQHPGGPVLFSLGGIGISGGDLKLYLSMAADQFGHGFEGAVFVVYLSILVNPRFPGTQYALFSGLAFLLPRLLAGLSGVFQTAIGYDGFFVMAGGMSLAAIGLVPWIMRSRPRADEDSGERSATR